MLKKIQFIFSSGKELLVLVLLISCFLACNFSKEEVLLNQLKALNTSTSKDWQKTLNQSITIVFEVDAALAKEDSVPKERFELISPAQKNYFFELNTERADLVNNQIAWSEAALNEIKQSCEDYSQKSRNITQLIVLLKELDKLPNVANSKIITLTHNAATLKREIETEEKEYLTMVALMKQTQANYSFEGLKRVKNEYSKLKAAYKICFHENALTESYFNSFKSFCQSIEGNINFLQPMQLKEQVYFIEEVYEQTNSNEAKIAFKTCLFQLKQQHDQAVIELCKRKILKAGQMDCKTINELMQSFTDAKEKLYAEEMVHQLEEKVITPLQMQQQGRVMELVNANKTALKSKFTTKVRKVGDQERNKEIHSRMESFYGVTITVAENTPLKFNAPYNVDGKIKIDCSAVMNYQSSIGGVQLFNAITKDFNYTFIAEAAIIIDGCQVYTQLHPPQKI